MSEEISLLPEELRKKEDALRGPAQVEQPKEETGGMSFFIPAEQGEDIEVIEVDEGEIDQVLAGEPALTKALFYATNFFEDLKNKLFQPRTVAPPPKLPPQFFKPPAPTPAPVTPSAPRAPQVQVPAPSASAIPSAKPAPAMPVVDLGKPRPAMALPQAAPMAAPAKPKAQVVPFSVTPRRVRVIRRVRKPMRVSFISENELKFMQVDVRKRRFTFFTMLVTFVLLLGAGYALLNYQLEQSREAQVQATTQLADVRAKISNQLKVWSSFQNLEPKLKTLANLLDKHVSPTQLLDELEQNTLPTVSYDSFSLTPDRQVALAVTADSLDSAAQQMVAFQNASFVKKADASAYAITYDSKRPDVVASVKFQVQLTLSDSALKQAVAVAPNP